MKSRSSRLLQNWHQKAIALIASLFIFIFYRISTQKEFSVPLEVTRPAGYELARDWPQEVHLIFRGHSNGEKIGPEDFKGRVDLSSFTKGGTVKGAVTVVSQRESVKVEALEFEYSPSVIEFLLEPVMEKYVPLDVPAAVTGVLPPGYYLESLSFFPQNVLLRGPKSKLERVAKATTERLDLTGLKGPFSTALKVETGGKFVRAVDAVEAKAHVVIRGKITLADLPLSGRDLRPDLFITAAPKGSVEIDGTERVIENIKPEAVALFLDCREVQAPGEYELPLLKPELPPEWAGEGKITDFAPKTATVEVARKEREEGR